MQKCEDMIMAFSAKNLKPDLNCVMGDNVRDCMNKIKLGDADLMSLDAADTWTAGKYVLRVYIHCVACYVALNCSYISLFLCRLVYG